MPFKKKPLRYSHCDGHTDLCYSKTGEYLVTCGNDGDVRVWTGFEDVDPATHHVTEKVFAVAICKDHLYVATDDRTVQIFTFPGLERDGIMTRFTAPVSHLSVTDKLVAAGSFDMTIHIVDVETRAVSVLEGHKGPVLGVALDPQNKYLASSSGDGTVRVWNIELSSEVKAWTCVPLCNSFYAASVLGRPCWAPDDGQLLAVPDGCTIILYHRVSWDKLHALSSADATQPFTISAFSPCGKFVAGCTNGGQLCVWDAVRDVPVGHVSLERRMAITGMAWNPAVDGEIVLGTMTGQIGLVGDCIVAAATPIVAPTSIGHPDSPVSTPADTFFADDDDDDDEGAISLERIKAETMQTMAVKPETEQVEQDDLESIVSKGPGVSELQPAFQPGATPTHLQHRFMLWNSVGLVRATNTQSETSVDVEFHDSSVHHALHLSNYLGHTLAALTDHLLALACDATDDTPSKLSVVLLNSWDGSHEWVAELPADEGALALAAGHGWVCVATDARLLRLWSPGGAQREVLSLPGPVVCVAGGGSRLLAVCHIGTGVEDDQILGYALLRVDRGVLTLWQPLPLSPRASLSWAGFSDEGTPCTQDSAGVVRMLTSRGFWLPVCHTKSHTKGPADHYFLLGLSEAEQKVRAVLCRGTRYPPTTPRPPVAELTLALPLCESASEKSVLENALWLSLLGRPSLPASPTFTMETVLKLFAMACRADQGMRAADLCELAPSPQLLQLAAKYASKLGRMALAEKISMTRTEDLYRRVEEDEGEKSEENFTPAPAQESLLLAAEQKSSDVQVRPSPIVSLSQRKRNPFCKGSPASEVGHGLERLSTATRDGIAGPSKVAAPSKPDVPPKPAKVTASNKEPFLQWFSTEKASLQVEFPDLSVAQLTKEALKRYKQLKPPQTSGKSIATYLGGKKKASEEEKENSSNCAAVENEHTKRQRSDDPEPTSQVCVDIEVKKRKTNSDATAEELSVQKEKEKPSAKNKLFAFSFKKT